MKTANTKLTIVASIPDGKFALDSMFDAEALIGILKRATPLKSSSDLPCPMRYMATGESSSRLVVLELLKGEPYSAEEGSRLIADEVARKARQADLNPFHEDV